ncbi:unnamed protein product [Didymodactylos carnosus]|uniref:Mos1 transposase HTH domain-containing protein n=1 Tax=Didymodactylos carnosus TaxID=1234261 RepID=A0A8S2EPC7_9BILA|nr:unnamed protein product [Didymodactylos carnosus]CAF4045463.1 unnamed protein product [Didymodactylos carnosus]
MTLDKIELRVSIRYCWKARLSTRDAAKEICDAEGARTVHYTTVSRWYKRFDFGDLSLEDQPRSGRPSMLDNEGLRAALEDEPSSSSRELASVFGVSSHQTVLNHLHQIDFVNKKPRQDPHELSASQLLENPLDDRFWKRIVTSDEKWIFLVNHNRQKQWVPQGQDPPSVPRQDRFGKKVMICVWWNFEGVLHFELVPNGRAVNAELCCQQLDRVYDKLKEKYPTLVRRKRALFQQDNAKPHTAKKTKEKFDELEEVEVLPHPAYSLDAAPSDYGLFQSMEHFLRGR